ncbi:MAG: hypothetical protein Q7T66_08070 [Herminiimonas sp.]|nr:hypothetical protein [Herminiimonas sp.]
MMFSLVVKKSDQLEYPDIGNLCADTSTTHQMRIWMQSIQNKFNYFDLGGLPGKVSGNTGLRRLKDCRREIWIRPYIYKEAESSGHAVYFALLRQSPHR